ncbi:MAG TPA: polysaccharide deacetylase family protein [Gemmatimonadaceae bacterium]|nr:polysaccharide deacetylase family protein [Gemmatimonadaceae bacterium]
MHRQSVVNQLKAAALVIVVSACASKADTKPAPDSSNAAGTAAVSSSDTPAASTDANAGQAARPEGFNVTAEDSKRVPNELGRIPVVEYHLIVDRDAMYSRQREHFASDLEFIYNKGYRPVTISQLLDRKINLPKGLSPVVFVFDDASPSQFSYIEKNGQLEIDPNSGMGIWLAFRKKHPDWTNAAVYCLLSGAAAGHNFFGNKGIDGQKDEWRFKKVRWLHEQGFELCNHTLWHANLSKYSDAVVQEQIARGQLAIDSAVPGFKVRTFALPLGVWPKNRALAKSGSWTDPKTRRVTTYNNEAILEVSGGPTLSPYDPAFNPLSIKRIEVIGQQMQQTLERLDKNGTRYVSDGDPSKIAKPVAAPADK